MILKTNEFKMRYFYYISFVFGPLLLGMSCGGNSLFENENPYSAIEGFLTYIEETPQRKGDSQLGHYYLVNGDYVNSGTPANLFRIVFPEGDNLLEREGKNLDIPFEYTQVTYTNGVEVVSPNCMQCHGGFVNNEFMIGAPNIDVDFTINSGAIAELLDLQIKNVYGMDSPEHEAYLPFHRAITAAGEHLITETVGSNSADKLALVLGAYRDRETLEWLDAPQYDIPEEVIPADVPAWWLLKKKNAMFSTGIGRGDFGRIMMASSVLTMKDSTKARYIDQQFINVAEYIRQLEPPVYPNEIDLEKADQGKLLFEETCSKCHGTYDEDEFYPNVIVDHSLLRTDSLLAKSNFAYQSFAYWYNNSWFSKGDYGGKIEPGNGYMAPPLDGIWATAPYLHNGSVPNLEALLSSEKRPKYWRRSPNNSDYNFEVLGISTSIENSKIDRFTFDTTLPGYSNKGHYFGDFMTKIEKENILEYLKTI